MIDNNNSVIIADIFHSVLLFLHRTRRDVTILNSSSCPKLNLDMSMSNE